MILVVNTSNGGEVILNTALFSQVWSYNEGRLTAFYSSNNDNDPILAKLPFSQYVDLLFSANAALREKCSLRSTAVIDLRGASETNLKGQQAPRPDTPS
jgi:hypothetical protein